MESCNHAIATRASCHVKSSIVCHSAVRGMIPARVSESRTAAAVIVSGACPESDSNIHTFTVLHARSGYGLARQPAWARESKCFHEGLKMHHDGLTGVAGPPWAGYTIIILSNQFDSWADSESRKILLVPGPTLRCHVSVIVWWKFCGGRPQLEFPPA